MSVVPTLHLALRDEAVERIAAGTSVDVQGMPGSGRSRLLRAIADELDDRGHLFLRMRGIAALADRPLEALAIAGLVWRRDAALASTSIAAAVAAVNAAVREPGTVLLVDDADELDEATAGVLLAAHAEHPFPLLSASTARPRAARAAHPLPAGVQPGVTLSVPALGYLDFQTLLADELDEPIDAAAAARIFTASGGLPGVALAIVDGARRAGSLALADGAWRAGAGLWTPDLERALEPFLRPLTPAAVEGLHAIALAGALDSDTARELVGWDVLEELDGYRLVRLVPRGAELVVGIFPPVLAERFAQQEIGPRRLKVGERIDAALGDPLQSGQSGAGTAPLGTAAPDPAAAPPLTTPESPIPTLPGTPVGADARADATPPAADADPVVNRMLLDRRSRLAAQRRADWEADPRPRTAEALLRTLLVADPDPAAVRAIVAGTPRTGEAAELVDFDAWTALAVGVAERDLDRVHEVIERARSAAPEWASFFDAVEVHVRMLLGHVPDPEAAGPDTAGAPRAASVARAVVHAEQLLARGRSAEALARLDEAGAVDDSAFGRIGAGVRGIALLLDGRLDEAADWASERLAAARAAADVDGIVVHAYTAAIALLMRLRISELRTLLASVLSTGVVSALQRPAEVGLLTIAATLAFDERRVDTARNLAGQAVAASYGPAWYPTATPGYALARLAGSDAPAVAALWAEYRELRARGCSFAALVSGVLATAEQPEAARTAELLELARSMPAPAARWFEGYLETIAAAEPDSATRGADALADAGLPFFAMRAYRTSIAGYSERGAIARAASATAAARSRLDAFAPEAAAVLGRPAAKSLTDREYEVARLAADGLANQQIASRLHLSVRTVENHLHRAFRKLGVDSRTALAEALAV